MKHQTLLKSLLISSFLVLIIIFSGCINKVSSTESKLYKKLDYPPPADIEYLTFQFINRIRIDNNLTPYIYDNRLGYIARMYSIKMYRENFFGHYDISGKDLEDRLLENRYLFFAAGENLLLARNQNCESSFKLARELVESWMNSVGHRRMILNPEMNNVGIGIFCSGGSLYATMITTKPCETIKMDLIEGIASMYNIDVKNKTLEAKIIEISLQENCNILTVYLISSNSLVEYLSNEPIVLNVPFQISVNSPYRCNVNLTICFRNDLEYESN